MREQKERKPLTQQQRDRRSMALLGLELTGLVVAAVAIGLIAGSCGEKQDAATTASTAPADPEPSKTVVASVGSHTPVPAAEGAEVASPDSLPPEVSASVIDSVVAPGAAVEVTAETSIDATELTLWDGLGKRQPMSYDQEGKVWRAFYRVPLKSSVRVGLSVTAKTDHGRWRRVWVFLRVERVASVTAPADSSR